MIEIINNNPNTTLAIAVALFLAIVSLRQYLKLKAIGDLEEKKRKILSELHDKKEKLNDEIDEISENLKTVKSEYKNKRQILEEIHTEILLYDMDVIQPPFEGTDDDFKAAIDRVREQQKNMAKNSIEGWGGYYDERLYNRTCKLSIKAFNFECDTLLKKLTLRNYESIKNRMIRARKKVEFDVSYGSFQLHDEYMKSKLLELDIHYSKLYKAHEEKEALRKQRELERDEAKLIKEREKAEEDERNIEIILKEAAEKSKSAEGEQLKALQAEIDELKTQLEKAHEKTERAQAMAELTRAGYVYVISNIGSFGKDILKIGMTRRLEPYDRVQELGDASVPFKFDVHAMVYTEDAPKLEKQLHAKFEKYRVNLANFRKEFFRVDPNAVKDAITELSGGEFEFYSKVIPEDYLQTMEMMNDMSYVEELGKEELSRFPESLD